MDYLLLIIFYPSLIPTKSPYQKITGGDYISNEFNHLEKSNEKIL